jgi:hypothetical protein
VTSPGESEGIGSPDWLPRLFQAGEAPTSIKINDDFMCLEIDGIVIATPRIRADGWWEVSHWPRFFCRNQAITA